MRWRQLLSSTGLIVFLSLFAVFSYPITVSAADPTEADLCSGFTRFGRDGCRGYFTNDNLYGDYGIQGENILDCDISGGCIDGASVDNEIPSSVDTAASFENLIEHFLGTDATAAYAYNRAGAAFIVDAMLGKDGSAFGSEAAGVKYAVDNWSTWVEDVNYYADHGMITWDEAEDVPSGTINSLHACVTSEPDCTTSDIASNDAKDFAFFRSYEDEESDIIIFHNPDGSTFEIRRECANLLGELTPLTTPAPIKATCGSLAISPDMPDPDTPYTITAAVDYSSADDATTVRDDGGKMFITDTGPSVSYNDQDVTITQSGGDLSGKVSMAASHNTGTYAITYGMTGSTGAITCTSSLAITDQPTTTTTGGDVEAGAGMGGTTCATPADDLAGIVSWNNGTSANEYATGAGTEYAALVLNHLQGFVTGQGTTLAGSGLSFGNSSTSDVDAGSGLFGGLFGSESCMPDYFANATNVQTGNVTIGTGGIQVANGTHTTIYVKGNVYIDGSITYSGSYADVGEIPSYSVIVEGNIYIAPGVSQLDGLYVAEPTVTNGVSTNGIIYTCASAPFTAAALNSNLYDTCDQSSLTVDGSFVARQVWLLRTTGTVTGTSAESFDFDPETWLTTPPADASSGSTLGSGYDAITELPPVL